MSTTDNGTPEQQSSTVPEPPRPSLRWSSYRPLKMTWFCCDMRSPDYEMGVSGPELGGDDVHSKAVHMRQNIIPAMAAVRAVSDKLERILPDDLWPLPRYRDMLFVK